MKTTRVVISAAIASLIVVNSLSAKLASAAIVAQTGFNDASGIHSNGTANSPYGNGLSVVGAGVGEPGWTNVWQLGGTQTGVGVASDATVFEGDLALRMERTGGLSTAARHVRFFPAQDSGIVSFSIQVNIENFNGQPAALYLIGTGGTVATFPGADAALVRIEANGSISAIGSNASYASTVFSNVFPAGTIQTGTWYQIEAFADLSTQKFNFSVNGGTPSADFNFRRISLPAQPITAINAFQIYHDAGVGYYDDLVISQVPEPSAVVLLIFGLTSLALIRVRRLRR